MCSSLILHNVHNTCLTLSHNTYTPSFNQQKLENSIDFE